MTKYIVHLNVGYAGMDSVEALELPDNHTQKELDDACWDMAVDHAERYGYYPPSDDTDDDNDEFVSENIEGWPEVYNPKKHDMLRAGGGSFADDF